MEIVKKAAPVIITDQSIIYPQPNLFIGTASLKIKYRNYLTNLFETAFRVVSGQASQDDLENQKVIFSTFCYLHDAIVEKDRLVRLAVKHSVTVHNRAELAEALVEYLHSISDTIRPVAYLFQTADE